jgi:hypothetical protein
MKEILVRALWKIDRETFIADEFKLVNVDNDKPFSRHIVRTHLLKSATKERVLYDFRVYTVDGILPLDDFTWGESDGIWNWLYGDIGLNSVMSEN